MSFWRRSIAKHNWHLSYGLEIGSRNGGVTLFFVRDIGATMVCSDLGGPTDKARLLHQQFAISKQVSYADIDAIRIPYANETFDFVVFKSVLGVIGARDRTDRITQAINEISRVLKPGGVLFFAENLQGSRLHQFARQKYVAWGRNWRYISLEEMTHFLSIFEENSVQTTGFFSAFIPKPEWLKNLVARFDSLLFFFPGKWQYVGYGYAIKKTE